MDKIKNVIFHAFIFVIMFGSLAEVIFGFLPIPSTNEPVVKTFLWD